MSSFTRQLIQTSGRRLAHSPLFNSSTSTRTMSSTTMDRHLSAVHSITALKSSQTHPDGHAAPLLRSFIDGAHVEYRASAAQYTVPDASTGDVLAYSQIADESDIDKAVIAAAKAQREWAKLSGTERGRILTRVAHLLTEKNDRLAELEAVDTGRPIQETMVADVVSARDCFEYFGGLAGSIAGEYHDLPGGSFAYNRKEPLGVTAGIGAFNYPIQGAAWKAAPALACGNAIIFKPAEDTPLTALALAEVLCEAGLPAGLFQVVLGASSTGQALSKHNGIRKVSFTGSAGTGKAISKDASANLKKVTMELGGKSPLIVFPDAELHNAVSAAMVANFYSNGEVCSNGTRVFVHESMYDEFVSEFVRRTLLLKVGPPMEPDTQVSALIHRKHLERVMGFVEAGKKEGATLACGGEVVADTVGAGFENGMYMSPAIFTHCHDDMSIVRNEIFGPVACVLSFKDEEEVIRRANDTNLGLSAGVFTNDLKRGHRVIHQLEAGTTWINNYNLAPVELPWAGHKESGIGVENGTLAIEHWTQPKSVYVEMGMVDCPYE